jgi:hypothetical protein
MELVHLLIVLRGPVWRVRILSGGTIRWRAYRVAEYPTPEAVVRRCVAGLARRGKDEGHDDNDAESYQHITQHEGPLLVRWEFQPWLWA